MEKIIYDNCTLENILETISNGLVGFEEDENVNDLVIVNNIEQIFKGIVIKPCSINIIDNVLKVIAQKQIKIDSLETEILEYVVFTAAIEDDEETGKTNHILINQSLSEYILMMKKANIDLLLTNGWKLSIIK